jgi:hypothetical protein
LSYYFRCHSCGDENKDWAIHSIHDCPKSPTELKPFGIADDNNNNK